LSPANTAADASVGCRLAPLPVQNEKLWGFAGADRSLVQVFSNDTVAVKIVGIEGPRLYTHQSTGYGMYGATMRVSSVVGAITAFYVSRPALSSAAAWVPWCIVHCAAH
jgi:hypothetical protein